MALRDRSNPLLFRKDGGLDVSQAILTVLFVYILVLMWCVGLGWLQFDTGAWAFFGSVVPVFFIAWVARDRADLIARQRREEHE